MNLKTALCAKDDGFYIYMCVCVSLSIFPTVDAPRKEKYSCQSCPSLERQ